MSPRAGGDRPRRTRRHGASAAAGERGWSSRTEERGQSEGSSDLHEERLDAVARVLLREGATSVLDLGCGSGSLLLRLARERPFLRLTGIDQSLEALRTAERLLEPVRAGGAPQIELRQGSLLGGAGEWPAADAAVLVETIEHLAPADLSRLERALFSELRPALVVITTPNRDFNPLLGVPAGQLRHPDHRFEWGRAKFEGWAAGLGLRHGYEASFQGIGPGDAWHGRPTQMAVLSRTAA